jgi:hypothetical protein
MRRPGPPARRELQPTERPPVQAEEGLKAAVHSSAQYRNHCKQDQQLDPSDRPGRLEHARSDESAG